MGRYLIKCDVKDGYYGACFVRYFIWDTKCREQVYIGMNRGCFNIKVYPTVGIFDKIMGIKTFEEKCKRVERELEEYVSYLDEEERKLNECKRMVTEKLEQISPDKIRLDVK